MAKQNRGLAFQAYRTWLTGQFADTSDAPMLWDAMTAVERDAWDRVVESVARGMGGVSVRLQDVKAEVSLLGRASINGTFEVLGAESGPAQKLMSQVMHEGGTCYLVHPNAMAEASVKPSAQASELSSKQPADFGQWS